MAKAILSKHRFAARDNERVVLQIQISTYAARIQADQLQQDLLQARNPLPEEPVMDRMNGFIEYAMSLVDEILIPPLPEHVHGWE